MDKRTLKIKIIELRDIYGLSYQDISDTLAQQYNIKMSRQAICGMYKRATSEESICTNRDLALATTDILNYYAIGINIREIKNIISSSDIRISSSDISNIIENNDKYLDEILKEQIRKVTQSVINNEDIKDLITRLAYKGYEPTKNKIDLLLKISTMKLLNDKAAEVLAKVYNMTDSRELIRDISNDFRICSISKEINKYINS